MMQQLQKINKNENGMKAHLKKDKQCNTKRKGEYYSLLNTIFYA